MTDGARFETWDEAYEGTPPWDIGRPQGVVLDLLERNAFGSPGGEGTYSGHVLDVGCGTGEHALYLAEAGFDVLGVDASERAIDAARAKAEARGVEVTFEVYDALRLPLMGRRFDTVLDVGLYHTFTPGEAERYVEGLANVTRAGGRVHVLCFSDLEPEDWGGPRRIPEAELRRVFGGEPEGEAAAFRVDRIDAALYETTIHDEGGGHAWCASFTRLHE